MPVGNRHGELVEQPCPREPPSGSTVVRPWFSRGVPTECVGCPWFTRGVPTEVQPVALWPTEPVNEVRPVRLLNGTPWCTGCKGGRASACLGVLAEPGSIVCIARPARLGALGLVDRVEFNPVWVVGTVRGKAIALGGVVREARA